VASVLLTVSAQIQLGMKPQFQPYLSLIFFATLFEYNRHRLVAVLSSKETLNSEKNRWVLENQKKFYFLVIVSVAGFIAAVISTKTDVLISFLPLGILTFLYLVPGSGNKNYFFKLREVPYLKIFLIAFVWSASTILLPVIQTGENIFNTQVILLFTERFFFILAIAIPFDIRDMKDDRDAGLKTIPLLINQKKALILSYLSLLFCFVISFFHYRLQNEWFVIEALCISLITTYLFMKLHFFRNLSKYYYPILDGTMLLQGMLVLAFYLINHNY
jgi:4-hydroxybenzoate polyprenyltransferase